MEICYQNGKFIAESLAYISCHDRGLLLADGLFETVRCYNGRAFGINQHWQRLNMGASQLKITVPLSKSEWVYSVYELLRVNHLQDKPSGCRITITRGPGERGLAAPTSPVSTVLITVFPVSTIAPNAFSLTLTPYMRNEFSPLASFKSLNYLDQVAALHQAQYKGFDDALVLNTQGRVCCASSANIFMVKNDQLYTPAVTEGALPGVTRDQVLMIAKSLSIKTYEDQISLQALHNADEVFLSNSLREIQAVSQFEKTRYHHQENSMTQTLLQALKSKIESTI